MTRKTTAQLNRDIAASLAKGKRGRPSHARSEGGTPFLDRLGSALFIDADIRDAAMDALEQIIADLKEPDVDDLSHIRPIIREGVKELFKALGDDKAVAAIAKLKSAG